MEMNSDQMRDEQQRQTEELTSRIRELLRQHAEAEPYPMLGAAVSALAHNLGETVAQVDGGKMRKSLRDGAGKVMRRAERTAPKLGNVSAVAMTGRH